MRRAPPPDGRTVLLDPAGLHHIQAPRPPPTLQLCVRRGHQRSGAAAAATRLTRTWSAARTRAQPPGGPDGAGGAAAAVYQWLGIMDEPHFPRDVVKAVKRPGDAKFHECG